MRKGRSSRVVLAVAVGVMLGCAAVAQANSVANVIFVVDESGSMTSEHAWLKELVHDLDAALDAENIDGKYGLVGFGGNVPHLLGHKHLVNGADFGDADQFETAVGTLIVSGGDEDGWDGIDTAMNDYAFDTGAAVNVILVTDEDRDDENTALTYASVLASLTGAEALLNACVLADAYIPDGSGGYTTSAGGIYVSGYGTTETDYINMAWATGAAAWDLDQLRAGGVLAESFSL